MHGTMSKSELLQRESIVKLIGKHFAMDKSIAVNAIAINEPRKFYKLNRGGKN